jgi:peptidoglycan hydrolase-like protein with peptidoglycan-binding domain
MDLQIFEAAKKAGEAYGVPAAWVAAVIAKESGGRVFGSALSPQRPIIRFEGHYFYQRLKGGDLAEAVRHGLASPKAGAVKNPEDQDRRWADLYRPACDIDLAAAQESTSWGVGQVMGAHWKRLCYSSVGDLVKAACSGLDGQVDLMMRYVREFGLIDELQRGDALGFARGYNGPKTPASYARDIERLARDFGGEVKTDDVAGMLRMGMRGAKVRELQALLNRAGSAVKVDGDFGPATKTALQAIQRKSGITADGVAGPETMQALAAYRVAPDEQLGTVPVLDTTEARQGTAAAIVGATGLGVLDKVQPYVDQMQSAADKLGGLSALSPIASYAATGLTILAGLAVAGGIIWGAVGWLKSKRTTGWA